MSFAGCAMTQKPHDQFAKQYLEALLKHLGTVEINRAVVSEMREVDVWFVPAAEPVPAFQRQRLGLLAQMATTTCLLEPFRNPPTWAAVRHCLLKLYSIHGEKLRQARRENTPLSEAELPMLWILSPSCSPRLRDAFAAKADPSGHWCQGIYFLPAAQKTTLVAINQLPVTGATLWLRVLGRGKTQEQAIDELIGLPEGSSQQRELLELLANWRINLKLRDNLKSEDQELIMNLSPAYLKWREETFQEGRQEGRQEGQRLMIENLLAARFGEVDEALSNLVESILQLSVQERAQLMLQLPMLSREELLARFRA